MLGTDCYSAPHYELNDNGLALKKITPEVAISLAEQLSEILPWRRIALGSQNLMAHFLAKDPALFRFAVFVNEECVGAVSVRFPWLKGPYLELLGLNPAFQGQGIGRAVLHWFEGEAPPGTRNAWMLCSDFNEAALGFYEALGYEKVTLIESLYAAGFDDFLLRKKLLD